MIGDAIVDRAARELGCGILLLVAAFGAGLALGLAL